MYELKTPKAELAEIAEKCKEIRLSLNMKRATLALKAGVSESTIKRFESGGDVSLHAFYKLTTALNIKNWTATLLSEKHFGTISDVIKNKTKPKKRGSR